MRSALLVCIAAATAELQLHVSDESEYNILDAEFSVRELLAETDSSYSSGSYGTDGGSYTPPPTPKPDECAKWASEIRCKAMGKHQIQQGTTEAEACKWNVDLGACQGNAKAAEVTPAPTIVPTKTPTSAAPTKAPTSAYTIKIPIQLSGYTVATFSDKAQKSLKKSLATTFEVEESAITLEITTQSTTASRRLADKEITVTAKINAQTKAAADAVSTKASATDLKSILFTSFKSNMASEGETVPATASILAVQKPVINSNIKEMGDAEDEKASKKKDNTTLIVILCAAVGGVALLAMAVKSRGKHAAVDSPVLSNGAGKQQALTRASLNQPDNGDNYDV